MEVSQIGYKYHFYIIFRGISWGSTVFLPDPSPARRAVGPSRALAIAPLCGDFSGLAKLERKLHQQNVSLWITVG